MPTHIHKYIANMRTTKQINSEKRKKVTKMEISQDQINKISYDFCSKCKKPPRKCHGNCPEILAELRNKRKEIMESLKKSQPTS